MEIETETQPQFLNKERTEGFYANKEEKGDGFIFYFEWTLALNILKPELTVKAFILDGFGDVGRRYLFCVFKVSDGAGDS